jgi:hypothetical protein
MNRILCRGSGALELKVEGGSAFLAIFEDIFPAILGSGPVGINMLNSLRDVLERVKPNGREVE